MAHAGPSGGLMLTVHICRSLCHNLVANQWVGPKTFMNCPTLVPLRLSTLCSIPDACIASPTPDCGCAPYVSCVGFACAECGTQRNTNTDLCCAGHSAPLGQAGGGDGQLHQQPVPARQPGCAGCCAQRPAAAAHSLCAAPVGPAVRQHHQACVRALRSGLRTACNARRFHAAIWEM